MVRVRADPRGPGERERGRRLGCLREVTGTRHGTVVGKHLQCELRAKGLLGGPQLCRICVHSHQPSARCAVETQGQKCCHCWAWGGREWQGSRGWKS